jgi:hypothetical protein
MILYAFVGEDEARPGEIGIKQIITRTGLTAAVFAEHHLDRALKMIPALQAQVNVFGKPIRLVKFIQGDEVKLIEPEKPKRIDAFVGLEIGKGTDIGWAIATLNADHTITRTCKGCGVTATSPIDPETNKVEEVLIRHLAGCKVKLGNNPILS